MISRLDLIIFRSLCSKIVVFKSFRLSEQFKSIIPIQQKHFKIDHKQSLLMHQMAHKVTTVEILSTCICTFAIRAYHIKVGRLIPFRGELFLRPNVFKLSVTYGRYQCVSGLHQIIGFFQVPVCLWFPPPNHWFLSRYQFVSGFHHQYNCWPQF